MSQLQKQFTSEQVKELLDRYLKNEIERKYTQEILGILGIRKRRFFVLLKQYKDNPQHFTVQYRRTRAPRTIFPMTEQNILKELSIDKKIIQNKEIPLKSYNYSYIKDRLRVTYHQKVSLPTIIDRAKKHGFYLKKPKRTLQDRLIRTCVRGDVKEIKHAQRVLNHELYRYNHQQVHSTTQEIPYLRFQRALTERQSLFREFTIKPPCQSVKDIFCLRMDRTIDPYRRISINNLQLKLNHAAPGKTVNLRIYPSTIEVSEIRCWSEGKLIDVQRIKNTDLKGVHF